MGEHLPGPEHFDDPENSAREARLACWGCPRPQACPSARRRGSDGAQTHGPEPDAPPAKVGCVVNDDAPRLGRNADALDAAQRGEPPFELGKEGVIATPLRHLEARAPRQAMDEVELVPIKHSARFFDLVCVFEPASARVLCRVYDSSRAVLPRPELPRRTDGQQSRSTELPEPAERRRVPVWPRPAIFS